MLFFMRFSFALVVFFSRWLCVFYDGAIVFSCWCCYSCHISVVTFLALYCYFYCVGLVVFIVWFYCYCHIGATILVV
jgi:hypothetical protein